jgi:hypothetical protein
MMPKPDCRCVTWCLSVYCLQNHKLVVLEGADHTFSNGSAMYELAAAVLPFISQHAHQQKQQQQ